MFFKHRNRASEDQGSFMDSVDINKEKPTDEWFENSGADNVHEVYTLKTTAEAEAIVSGYAAEHGVNRRKLKLKIDLCILPPVVLLYLLAFLDRLNISNANIYGLSDDLHMKGDEYNVALALFFVPYLVFEIPANWLLKYLSPHVFLSVCLTCFGGVTIGQGFVRSYHQLLACRFLLGLLETSMVPSCFYLLGSWYTRGESQKRYTFFFSATSLAGAFGGLIAYGMNTLNMKQGLEGWRWLFIVEGAITSFCGIFLFFLIADFPETAKFLKENEREFMRKKLALDQGDSGFEITPTVRDILGVFKDWKTWSAAFQYFGVIIGIYGYAYFSTAIIKTFDLSPVATQVYSIYPWIVSFVGSVLVAALSDWARHRYAFTLAGCIVAIVGYAMLLGTDATSEYKHVRYGACFLACFGVYSAGPIVVGWCNMNFNGHTRKMVSSAFQIGFANIGGIISVFIYRAKDAPSYKTGLWTTLAMILFGAVMSFIYLLGLIKENRDRDRGKGIDKWNQLTRRQRLEAGDLNPAYRYMY